MNNYCAFSKGHHCIKWQDYVSARLELEECDELCHGNWIEIESLQRQVHFLKKFDRASGSLGTEYTMWKKLSLP